VAGKHGAVVEEGFYSNLAKPSVQTGKGDKILAVHVQRESHDTSQDHSDPKWRKCESFQGNRSVVGNCSGPWTGWINPAPV